MWDTRLMAVRPWRWLKTLIVGLLTRPPVTAHVWPTRLQRALYGPIDTSLAEPDDAEQQ